MAKKLGLSYPTLSSIATKAGIYRHFPRGGKTKKEREEKVFHSLTRGRTFKQAAKDNDCGKPLVSRIAKEHGIVRPGCPPLSYTRDEEGKVLDLLHQPSVSYPRIADQVGLRGFTVFNIAVRNGVRRRPPALYRGEALPISSCPRG